MTSEAAKYREFFGVDADRNATGRDSAAFNAALNCSAYITAANPLTVIELLDERLALLDRIAELER